MLMCIGIKLVLSMEMVYLHKYIFFKLTRGDLKFSVSCLILPIRKIRDCGQWLVQHAGGEGRNRK